MHIENFTIVCSENTGVTFTAFSTDVVTGQIRQISYSPATSGVADSGTGGFTAKDGPITFSVTSSTQNIIYRTTLLNARWMVAPMKKPVNSSGAAMGTTNLGRFSVCGKDRVAARVVVAGTSTWGKAGTFTLWVEGVI